MYTPHKTSRPFGGRRQKSVASVLEKIFLMAFVTFFSQTCAMCLYRLMLPFLELSKFFFYFKNLKICRFSVKMTFFQVFLTVGAAKVPTKDSKLPIKPFVVSYNDTARDKTYKKRPNWSQQPSCKPKYGQSPIEMDILLGVGSTGSSNFDHLRFCSRPPKSMYLYPVSTIKTFLG